MKICIFGAGAIGGFLAGRLAKAGSAEVSLVARGPHLAAIRERGLTLREGGEEYVTHPRAAADASELGPQDYVVITLKAHAVPGVVPAVQPLLGPETAIVMAVNGVPWWYFYGLPGPWRDMRLSSIDPGDVQWQGWGPQRVIGCVVYPAAEVREPGVIEVIEGDRFTLGEPDGSRSERVVRLAEALIAAGLKAPIRPRIRDEIWVKLWGNLSFNPISALTHATLEQIVGDPGTRAVARAMMLEAQEIAEKLGVRFPITVDKRIEGAGAVGAHKTSMLQDLERGRPMEHEALVGAVAELGRITGTPTPIIDTVLALIRLRAQTAGLS
ncbi:MAG: 2-dehydropantoate 2-reductase [Rhodovarius sp.]|nr:2-dehydropantoate 2-reductase [Rhodovarius sp.]MDW8315228.1 2-dehydropantoate 2-reductase [Rhodovarius sp.]